MSNANMEQKIYDMLQKELPPSQLLDDIAVHFFTLVRTELHLYAEAAEQILAYPTFGAAINAASLMLEDYSAEEGENLSEEERYEKAMETIGASQADAFLMDVCDFVDMNLQDSFDGAENSVKEVLMQEPLLTQIKEDMRAKNVLLLNPIVNEDQIEMFYVNAFKRWDALKEKLRARVLELSPQKAYEEGEKSYRRFMTAHHYLMDDDDLIEALIENENLDELFTSLYHKYYLAVTIGRHYVPDMLTDDNVSDPSDELELESEYDTAAEPEALVEQGDLRDMRFELVCDLYPLYTGRRVFETDEDANPADGDGYTGAYWTTYEVEFHNLILDHFARALEMTLTQLQSTDGDKLANLADQYLIPDALRTDPWTYMSNLNAFSYYLERMYDQIQDLFGYTKADVAYEKGKAVEESLPRPNDSELI